MLAGREGCWGVWGCGVIVLNSSSCRGLWAVCLSWVIRTPRADDPSSELIPEGPCTQIVYSLYRYFGA